MGGLCIHARARNAVHTRIMPLFYRGRHPRTPDVWVINKPAPQCTRTTVEAMLIAHGYDKDNMQVYHLRSKDMFVIAPLYTQDGFRCCGIAPDLDTIMFRNKDANYDEYQFIKLGLDDLPEPPVMLI